MQKDGKGGRGRGKGRDKLTEAGVGVGARVMVVVAVGDGVWVQLVRGCIGGAYSLKRCAFNSRDFGPYVAALLTRFLAVASPSAQPPTHPPLFGFYQREMIEI